MNGPQHFREAEKLARLSHTMFLRWHNSPDHDEDNNLLGSAYWYQAQGRLHAELAMAGATAAAFGIAWEAEQREEAGQWSRALGPEPLVACGARLDEDSPEICHLAVGHDGPHEYDGPGGLICWSDANEPRDPESEDQAPCVCGDGETRHAGRLQNIAPRGVCLTNCGCLQYIPATQTVRSTS